VGLKFATLKAGVASTVGMTRTIRSNGYTCSHSIRPIASVLVATLVGARQKFIGFGVMCRE